MASIPLPALDLKSPQQPDLMSQYANLLQLQNLKAQQANIPLQQEAMRNQVQSSGLQVQQQQQQLNDQKAMTAAMKDWDGKDYNSLIPLVTKYGGSAQAVIGLKKNILDQQTQIATANKDNSQAAEAQVTATAKKNDLITGALSPLLDPSQVPDQTLPQTLVSTVQSLQQQGLLDPQHAQKAAQLAQSGDPSAIRSGIDQFSKTLMAQSQIQDAALKKAQTADARARTGLATVQTRLAPQLAASKLAFQQAQLRQGAQRLGLEQNRLNLQQSQLGLSPDGAPSEAAQAIASGHIVPERMSYLLSRNPGLINEVMKLDPSFDGSKAAAYPSVYKDFTNSKAGSAGGSLLAGSTALEHLKELQALNTNESHNPLSASYTAYKNKAETVASELDRFYHGTSTDTATKNIRDTLMSQLPGQRDAAILTQAQSMGDRLDNYEQTWKNAAPSSKYEAPMPGISQTAKNARSALDPSYAQRMRGSGDTTSASSASGLTVTAPNGKTYTFKDQATADAFKKSAGIQ